MTDVSSRFESLPSTSNLDTDDNFDDFLVRSHSLIHDVKLTHDERERCVNVSCYS